MKKTWIYNKYAGFAAVGLGVVTILFLTAVKPLFGLSDAYFSLYGADLEVGWLFNVGMTITAFLLLIHLNFVRRTWQLSWMHPFIMLSALANFGLLLLALFPTTTPSLQKTLHSTGALLFIVGYPLVLAAASVVVYARSHKALGSVFALMAITALVGFAVVFASDLQVIWGQIWVVIFAATYVLVLSYLLLRYKQ